MENQPEQFKLEPKHVFIVIIASFFVMNFGTIALSQMGLFSLESKIQLLWGELFVALPALIFVLRNKLNLVSTFRLKTVEWRVLILAFFLVFPIVIISDELDRLMQLVIPIPTEFLDLYNKLFTIEQWSDWILLIATVGLLAGFVEEALFRGFAQQVFEDNTDVTRAVLITAFLFAFMHANPYSIVQIVLLGVFLGVIAWRTNSALPGMVIHITYNTLSILYTNVPEATNWMLWHEHVNPILVAASCALVYFGMRAIYKATE